MTGLASPPGEFFESRQVRESRVRWSAFGSQGHHPYCANSSAGNHFPRCVIFVVWYPVPQKDMRNETQGQAAFSRWGGAHRPRRDL